MCLPFCGGNRGREDFGPADPKPQEPQPQPPTATSDQKTAALPVKQDTMAPGRRPNGEHAPAASNSSDDDVPSVGVLRGRKGAPENTTALTPAPGAQAPQVNEYAAAAAPHHGSLVAASQPKKATDKMRAAPAPQVARRDEDNDDPAAANDANGGPDHGGEDDRKPRGKSWW